MIFKYGSYSHDQNEVMLRTSVQGIFDRFNRRMGETIEWTLLGVKQAASQSELTTALDALIDAYNEDYRDWGLYLDDGITLTRHAVLNSETFGGTKVVVPPSFVNGPWTGRVEYLNRRTYYIVLRAEIRVGEGLYSWKERLRIQGSGGPKWRYSPQEVGLPQVQTLQTATTITYIQEGEAVGREEYPVGSAPLFPLIEHGDMRQIMYETPEDIRHGSAPEMFPVGWRYVMEAVTPQVFTGFVLPTV